MASALTNSQLSISSAGWSSMKGKEDDDDNDDVIIPHQECTKQQSRSLEHHDACTCLIICAETPKICKHLGIIVFIQAQTCRAFTGRCHGRNLGRGRWQKKSSSAKKKHCGDSPPLEFGNAFDHQSTQPSHAIKIGNGMYTWGVQSRMNKTKRGKGGSIFGRTKGGCQMALPLSRVLACRLLHHRLKHEKNVIANNGSTVHDAARQPWLGQQPKSCGYPVVAVLNSGIRCQFGPVVMIMMMMMMSENKILVKEYFTPTIRLVMLLRCPYDQQPSNPKGLARVVLGRVLFFFQRECFVLRSQAFTKSSRAYCGFLCQAHLSRVQLATHGGDGSVLPTITTTTPTTTTTIVQGCPTNKRCQWSPLSSPGVEWQTKRRGACHQFRCHPQWRRHGIHQPF